MMNVTKENQWVEQVISLKWHEPFLTMIRKTSSE